MFLVEETYWTMPDTRAAPPPSLTVASYWHRVNLIQDNTDRLALSSVRYSMATAVMLWQAPVLGFGAPK